MNYKYILLFLFLLRVFSSSASGADTLKIFYPINKFELKPADRAKIKALADTLSSSDTIKVLGYADYLGNAKDNLVLSLNRAQTIKTFIMSLNKNVVVVAMGEGEIATAVARSAEGEPFNRRVDIIKTTKAVIKPVTVEHPQPGPVELKLKPAEPKPDSPVSKAPAITASRSEPVDERSFREKVNGLDKLEPGSSISLEELTFQPGRHFLNPEAVRYVNTLLKYLKKHSNIVFEIDGHICCEVGNRDGEDFDTGGLVLSINRAKFIYDYFLKNGISADRMSYKGVGSSKPKVFPERSEHDRYLNRRVEIRIISR